MFWIVKVTGGVWHILSTQVLEEGRKRGQGGIQWARLAQAEMLLCRGANCTGNLNGRMSQ